MTAAGMPNSDFAPLARIDLPPLAYELHLRIRKLLTTLRPGLEPLAEPIRVKVGADLFEKRPDTYAVLEGGVLKLSVQDRLVRLYSGGDLIRPSLLPEARAEAMFGCEVATIPRADFETWLDACADRRRVWRDLCEAEHQLLQLLCAAHAPEDIEPHVALRSYGPGEVVVQQGDARGEVFELLEGEASVHIDRIDLGRVREGDIFGEMSFLTGRARSATVIAHTHCLIQVIGEEDFARAARSRPELMLSLNRTLAKRVDALGRHLVTRCYE